MTDIKLSLTIILPGRVMFSQEESLKELKKPLRNSKGKIIKKRGRIVYKTVKVPAFDKNDTFTLALGPDKEETTVFVRKTRPVKQIINMTEEAYESMLSKFPPNNYRGKVRWESLSKNQKIKWHCMQIAAHLGGTFGSFQVLD